MKDLLNEINESMKFTLPKTGSWGYYQFGSDKEKEKESKPKDSEEGDSGTVGESNVTSNLDGGEGPVKTPYAFSGDRKVDKEKRISNVKASGKDYKLVGDIYESFENVIESIDETVNEVSYTAYKKDERTGRQKVNGTLIDVYRKLKEVENLLDINVKLKNEDDLHGEMWPKASPKRMQRIDRKIEVIKRKLKKMY